MVITSAPLRPVAPVSSASGGAGPKRRLGEAVSASSVQAGIGIRLLLAGTGAALLWSAVALTAP